MRAIIFDVDGTLAETEEAHRAAFNETFRAAGLDWFWDETLYSDLLRVTGGKERMRHYMATYVAEHISPESRARIAADLHPLKTTHYESIVASGAIRLRPGIGALIHAVRRENIRMAIATTTSLPNVTALLTATLGEESIGWFDTIAAGDCVAAKKPAPDIYWAALSGLRLSPGECLAVEDSHNGVRAAAAAGVPVVATRSIYCLHDHMLEAARVVENMTVLGTSGAKVLAELRRIHLASVSRTTRERLRLAS
jgi:HAD superfamily hydrolase (TIGR01509 family)